MQAERIRRWLDADAVGGLDSATDVHLGLAPADVAWKSRALRMVFCDPRWVPNPTRQSRYGRALPLRVSRESEVAATETHAAGGVALPACRGTRCDSFENHAAGVPIRGGAVSPMTPALARSASDCWLWLEKPEPTRQP